ncbi:MAG: hypothetical protein GQ468_02800 [Candidatus Scalindua sp.]|nr:hypothetical protein [Candidatus Scalindua sp.]
MTEIIQLKLLDRFFDTAEEMQEYVQSDQYKADIQRKLKDLAREEALLGEQMKGLSDRRVATRGKIAAINCPFYVGQKIINKDHVCAQVERIGYSGHDSYHLIVRKLTKSGRLYKTFNKTWRNDLWRAYDENKDG